MILTGTVTGREVKVNRDGKDARLLLQVEITNPDDVQTVEYVPLPGLDANPINGSKVYIAEVGPGYKIAFAVDDGVIPSVQPGEQSLYAVDDSGAVQAFIDLLKTGEIDLVGVATIITMLPSGIIEINGNADFAVRFLALETALQLMVTQFNAALGAKLDGSGTPGTVALDISGAKVDEVKLP